MPWVESTEEGDQLRAARAKEEKKKKKRGTKTVQVASSSRLPLAGRRSAKRTDTYTPSISSSPSPAEDYPYTAKLPRITSSSVTAAASLAIHLEDLSRFEEVLSEPNQGQLILEGTRVRLECIKAREEAVLRLANEVCQLRSAHLQSLIDRAGRRELEVVDEVETDGTGEVVEGGDADVELAEGGVGNIGGGSK